MRKRLVVYVLGAILLAIFTWYIPSLIVCAISALAIAVYETTQSGKPAKSALAVTVFSLVTVTAYTLYWAGIVFLGYGGEQLAYLQIGMSPDWLIQDFQFYRSAIWLHLVQYSLIALIVGPLLGGGTGWLLIQNRLLPRPAL